MPWSLRGVHFLVALGIAALATSTCSVVEGQENLPSVHLVAVDPFGVLLKPLQVLDFTRTGGRKTSELADRFHGGDHATVPAGHYFVRVRAGDRIIAQHADIPEADTLIVLSGPRVIADRAPNAVSGIAGRVEGFSGTDPAWVKMVRVYSEDVCCTIVPVTTGGAFSPRVTDPGDYLLLVLHGGGILFEGKVRIEDRTRRIHVDLNQRAVYAESDELR